MAEDIATSSKFQSQALLLDFLCRKVLGISISQNPIVKFLRSL